MDLLVTVGPLAAAMRDAYDGEAQAVADAAEAASMLPELLEPGDTVLVKGSRGVGLEAVAEALAEDVGLMGKILIAGTASLLICIFLSPKFISFLREREFGQNIRPEGPQGHHEKAGTPTMGGIIIIVAIAAPFLILSSHTAQALGVFGAAIACGLVGFADDYTKIVKRRSLGLRARTKLIVTIAISLGLWWVATEEAGLSDELRLRIVDYQIDLGIFYPGADLPRRGRDDQAVNLTDGLDGLAAGCAAIVLLAFIGITFITTGQRDLALLSACLVGGCIGFLWFNSFPAHDLHGRHGVARPGRRDRRTGRDDQDRDPPGHPRRDLRHRGAVGGDPGVRLPGLPQARVPDGPDPPPLRADGLVGDQDHPALLDRRRGLQRDRLHDLPEQHQREPWPSADAEACSGGGTSGFASGDVEGFLELVHADDRLGHQRPVPGNACPTWATRGWSSSSTPSMDTWESLDHRGARMCDRTSLMPSGAGDVTVQRARGTEAE